MTFEHLHDRMAYIDNAKHWLDNHILDLKPWIVQAISDWIDGDLAGWRSGTPPLPPVGAEDLQGLGNALTSSLFCIVAGRHD
ncbi:hypothetical protein [uncultured Sphingomonas sp.]|uniref:hypothetical protein n=1 Tax=uncultured Sphingomonas sp. TaxID=158754 RepID=UPI002632A4DF|nr:hypothetical protein [uncultured Sphingomonas sp.]